MTIRNVPIILHNRVTMKIETGETFLVSREDNRVFDFWTKANASTDPTPFYLSISDDGDYAVKYGAPTTTGYLTTQEVLAYVADFNDKVVEEFYANGLEDNQPPLLEFVSSGGSSYGLRMFGCWLFDSENQDPLSHDGDNTLPWLDTSIKNWVHTVAKSLMRTIPDKL